MKGKWIKPLLFLSGIALVILFCCMVIHFLDVYANGALLNWFTWNYTNQVLDSSGRYIYELNWSRIRTLVPVVLVFLAVFWFCTVFLVSQAIVKRRARRMVTEISGMIQLYMAGNVDNVALFPREYAEISTQMTAIRTTMQRHEQILKEEVNRKNDLIVYLAHDLKTPLTSVIGYLSLLEEAPEMPPEQRAKYVHITLEKALRLEELINEFFEITRYNLQQIILEKEQIDLYYMLMQMTDEFFPILQAHGNTVKLLADENLTVYGDPVKLARVFNNILKNAVAYSYENTVIQVEAKAADGHVAIVFQNHGRTIPPQKLDMIFEKFFRLDSARATNTGGAGLGLAIAKEIVTLHGGTITAASEDEITTFCVTLPVG